MAGEGARARGRPERPARRGGRERPAVSKIGGQTAFAADRPGGGEKRGTTWLWQALLPCSSPQAGSERLALQIPSAHSERGAGTVILRAPRRGVRERGCGRSSPWVPGRCGWPPQRSPRSPHVNRHSPDAHVATEGECPVRAGPAADRAPPRDAQTCSPRLCIAPAVPAVRTLRDRCGSLAAALGALLVTNRRSRGLDHAVRWSLPPRRLPSCLRCRRWPSIRGGRRSLIETRYGVVIKVGSTLGLSQLAIGLWPLGRPSTD